MRTTLQTSFLNEADVQPRRLSTMNLWDIWTSSSAPPRDSQMKDEPYHSPLVILSESFHMSNLR